MQKGQTVKAIRGKAKGNEGVVFWLGHKWDHDRCGFKSSDGEAHWAKVADCIVINEAIQAVGGAPKKKKGFGPRRFARMSVTRVSHRAILANGNWWPKSQAFVAGDGWLCATEWIIKQKYDGVIPLCWMTANQKASWEAANPTVNDIPVNVAAEAEDNWGKESWVAIAEKLSPAEQSDAELAATPTDVEKLSASLPRVADIPTVTVTEADVDDALCGLFAD